MSGAITTGSRIAHPRTQSTFFGHEAARMQLAHAVNAGRLHHAWLLEGPRGIGKATLAFRLAKALVTARDGMVDGALAFDPLVPRVRLVEACAHPDVLLLERPWDDDKKRFKADLPVEQVRGLAKFFSTHASDGGYRVAIIDSADDMNWNACNALLKLLEEPPQGGLLLLVSHAPGRLLATIRSRCRRLALRPLGGSDMSAGLAHLLPDMTLQACESLIEISQGSLGRAVELVERGGLALMERMGSPARPVQLDPVAQHALADELAKAANEGTFDLFLSLAEQWLCRAAHEMAVGGAGNLIAARACVDGWNRIKTLARQQDSLHLDRKYVALAVLDELQNAGQKTAHATANAH